jgi:hypothetical protein
MAKTRKTTVHKIRIGLDIPVSHPTFGPGMIIAVGDGNALVEFADATRRIALEYLRDPSGTPVVIPTAPLLVLL